MNEIVSIIMPSYNTAEFIKDSVNSVIAQTYQNWELIIVDDCSTDNTDEVVGAFSDSRIRYIKNGKNSGAAYSRNRALREAKGKWIAFLDSDDLWFPEKLEKQLDFMIKNNYHFSYTEYDEINADGLKNGIVVSGPKRITERGMKNYCWPGCLTVMYDSEYVGLVQIENIKKNNDYAMWLKVSKKAECFLLPDILAEYRRGRSGSISTNGVLTMVKWHYRLFREAEKEGAFMSLFNTVRNLFWGTIKKVKYQTVLNK